MPPAVPAARLRAAVAVVRAGGLVAYPTEGVWGLGCDPFDAAALERLCTLKRRAPTQGFVVVVAQPEQLDGIVGALDAATRRRIATPAPVRRPVTWVVPAAAGLPPLLTGGRDTVAVRVVSHPPVAALASAAGPLVSTSANPTGRPPARSALTVRRYFAGAIDALLPGPLGGAAGASEIRDAVSGRVLRPAAGALTPLRS